ncbi:venom carboxylesterase-6-like [Anthonomus grandis grandis]|uniref:venom carboxylesterase-6-like n=1 Tax=Anthonomus grandis grandis TaxID=2921223 RepID=UPI002166934A|nr:venom carboxylesterase-6-like [Anthonomus grandis grandis]
MTHSVNLLFVLIATVFCNVLVELPDGKIQGKTITTRTGTRYDAYLGIRYAQNPTGELRFQPPIPVEPWNGIYDATTEKGICYQVVGDYPFIEREDCLMLNVFRPAAEQYSTGNLAVMVYIHGGGFIIGAGIQLAGVGPKFLMEYGVILVAFNYRVGPFGFISTGDDVIPGNMGMKDQILALKWVQKNIQYFGGDPRKVTIIGESAGAASVSYLLLSPLAQGLFRAAIMESGSAISPWAYQPDQVEITYKTAAILDSKFETNRNSSELLEFLQAVSARELDRASYKLSQQLENAANVQISQGFFYAPVLEHKHEGAFLTEYQYGSFENGSFIRVPVFLGLNDEEALYFMPMSIFNISLQGFDANLSYLVPHDMHIKKLNKLQEVGKLIKKFYSPNDTFTSNRAAGVRYLSNHDIDKSVIKQAELQAPYTPVYLYEFTYHGKMGNNNKHFKGTGYVEHAEEQNYYFSKFLSFSIPDNTDLTKFPKADVNVHYRFTSLLTNFVKELNPTPRPEEILQNVTWPTVKPGKWKYLEIGRDLVVHNGIPKARMYSFWTELYGMYANKPYTGF